MKTGAPNSKSHRVVAPRSVEQEEDRDSKQQAEEILSIGKAALLQESEAIRKVAERLDGRFVSVVNLLLRNVGKVVVTGLGKSGHVAQKLAATLSSTGTPAVFLHAAEAAHGDLGMYAPGDPTIMISKSGATGELLQLIPILRRFKSTLIGILGNANSPLGNSVDFVLDARVAREADPLNLAPTSSTAAALAIGDAIAIATMKTRGFTDAEFALYHPAGQLGRNLLLTVSDVMHGRGETATVAPADALRNVVIAMTHHPLGAACVIDQNGLLVGIITDGDIRRTLQNHDDIRPLVAADIMTKRPVAVRPDAPVKEAMELMEGRSSQISVLPVVGSDGNCLGLLRLHDVYQTARA
jgi:arabinose-5-phosphate isomerase